jgi:hypothetical protein
MKYENLQPREKKEKTWKDRRTTEEGKKYEPLWKSSTILPKLSDRLAMESPEGTIVRIQRWTREPYMS